MRRLRRYAVYAGLLAACSHPQPIGEPLPALDPAEITYSIFLIGDAGGPPDHDQVLRALERDLTPIREKGFVVFLGDNIYPRGLPAADAPDYSVQRERLARQVEAVTNAGARYHGPGNHDWDKSGPAGFEAIVRQGAMVNELGRGLVTFAPEGGCPGPVVRDEGPFRVILLDTEWLLRDTTMSRGTTGCAASDDSTVMRQLDVAVRDAGHRQVIVGAHHPLESGGVHGGHFTVIDHLFPLTNLKSWAWLPLPIIGSIYPLVRGNGLSVQDIPNDRNRRLRAAMEAVFKRYPVLVYAAGHDHSLQVISGSSARWL
jgi:hypothetical protein